MPVVGATWSAQVTRPTEVLTSASLLVRSTRLSGDGVQAPAPFPVGAGGRILVAGTSLATLPGSGVGLVRAFDAPIPASLALVGLHFAAQAVVLGGGAALSSAVEGTVGTG